MIEILIPIRNPTEVFAQTIDSLLAQTHRDFSVLLSDNFSTTGAERIATAAERLTAAGIRAQIIRPPWELGRVQHWNWLHHQSQAEWLKPLFVGDWLEPDCLAECVAASAADLEAAFLLFYFRHHRGGVESDFTMHGVAGRLEPARAAELVLFCGNSLGGPVNVLYRRAAFQAMGGHETAFPLLADFELYARLALHVPTRIVPRVLGHFFLHESRFSKRGSGSRRESMNAEFALVTATLRYAAAQAGLPVARGRFPRMIGGHLWRWAIERLFRIGGRVRRSFSGA